MPRTVVAALYEHKHGEDIRVFATHEQAEKWRQEIADEWWESEITEFKRPADPATCADSYFEIMAEGREFFTVQECVLEEVEEQV